jgi:branched-chain amino acid aminotransferase
VLAFYEHRVGAICKDTRAMLMPLDDHIVHRGDGIFETVKYEDRRLYQLDAHMTRLARSAKAVFIDPPCPWEEVREAVIEVARAGGEPLGLVRVLLGRGPGGFGISASECPRASLYVVAYRFTPLAEEGFEKGFTACKTNIPAKQSWLATIKSVNYLANALMLREAKAKGCDYPFCFDEHGFLAEGAIENVAIVDDRGALVIPELTNALSGTTLMRAVDLVKGEMPVTFRGVTEGDIYQAREVLIFGTTRDCVSVVRYNGKPIHDVRPGPAARRIRSLLRKDIAENGVLF